MRLEVGGHLEVVREKENESEEAEARGRETG